ncbi:hypothetical protein N9786_00810 [Flavobacteriaceae bacterium]|nr:hypothetical protein [Flavobacteriaceae bacterium]
MKIELILLGIIGVVFLIDFLMKGVKKKTESNDMMKADEEEVNIPKQRKGRYIYYLYAFVGSVIIGIISTYLINYFYLGVSLEYFINNFRDDSLLAHITNFTISFGITLIFIGFVLHKKYGLFTIKSPGGSALLYILNRKKNITLFILSICIIKLCIHYFIYYPTNRMGNRYKSFSWHLDNLFNEKINLFIAAVIFISLVVWLFNDKIKAR